MDSLRFEEKQSSLLSASVGECGRFKVLGRVSDHGITVFHVVLHDGIWARLRAREKGPEVVSEELVRQQRDRIATVRRTFVDEVRSTHDFVSHAKWEKYRQSLLPTSRSGDGTHFSITPEVERQRYSAIHTKKGGKT